MHVLVECAHACICAVLWPECLRCVSVEYVYVCVHPYMICVYMYVHTVCHRERERKRERGREERLREVEREREREIKQHRERAHVRIHGMHTVCTCVYTNIICARTDPAAPRASACADTRARARRAAHRPL